MLNELRKIVIAEFPRQQGIVAQRARIHPKTMSAFMRERQGLSIESIESLAAAVGRKIVLVPIETAKRGSS